MQVDCSCIDMHRFDDRCATLAGLRSERTLRARGAPTDARISDQCNTANVDHNLACNILHPVNLHMVQRGQRDPRYWCNEFAGGFRHVDIPCCVCFVICMGGVSGSSCDRARRMLSSWIYCTQNAELLFLTLGIFLAIHLLQTFHYPTPCHAGRQPAALVCTALRIGVPLWQACVLNAHSAREAALMIGVPIWQACVLNAHGAREAHLLTRGFPITATLQM